MNHNTRSIQSVLNQTYTNFELIIIDDDSKDNTLDIADSFKDTRLKIIKNDNNLGLQGNWDKALRLCNGEYVKLLPADDTIYSTCIQKQFNIFCSLADENLQLVCCNRAVIDNNDKIVLNRKSGFKGIIKSENVLKWTIRKGTNLFGEPGAVLLKKSHCINAGGFLSNYQFLADLDCWTRMLILGTSKVYFIDEILCTFRVHKNSASIFSKNNHHIEFSNYIREYKQNINLSWFDETIGKTNARINESKRALFYKYFLK